MMKKLLKSPIDPYSDMAPADAASELMFLLRPRPGDGVFDGRYAGERKEYVHFAFLDGAKSGMSEAVRRIRSLGKDYRKWDGKPGWKKLLLEQLVEPAPSMLSNGRQWGVSGAWRIGFKTAFLAVHRLAGLPVREEG